VGSSKGMPRQNPLGVTKALEVVIEVFFVNDLLAEILLFNLSP
jgi:hypothetical protein